MDRGANRFSHHGGPDRRRLLWKAATPVFRCVGRAVFSLRVERHGDIPTPPFVVAANHYSHIDGPLIGAVLGVPVRFLVVEDLFGERRLLDWLVLGSGAIPLPRHRIPLSALRTALQALDSGAVVGVFPEGTRVTHWRTLAPRRGAAWLAVRAGVPLLPVAVIGSGRAFGLDNRFRPAPVRVVTGPALIGSDATLLARNWERWITDRIAEYPGSEVPGPSRAFYDG